MAAAGGSWSKGRFVAPKQSRALSGQGSYTDKPFNEWPAQKVLSGSGEFTDAVNPILAAMLHDQGFDALPTVSNQKQFEAAIRNGEREVFRGIAGENASYYVQQFISGPVFTGGGVFGSGTYVSPDRAVAKTYAETDKNNVFTPGGGSIMRMTIKKDARIVDFDEITKQYNADTKIPGKLHYALKIDIAHYAVYKGYDGIRGRWQGEEHITILNRGKVRVLQT